MFLYIIVGFLLGLTVSLAGLLVGVYTLFMRVGTQQQQHICHVNELKHSISHLPPPQSNTPIETCIWLNTILTRVCTDALASPQLIDNCYQQLHAMLNKAEARPDMVGDIQITDINMGSGLPQVEGVKLLTNPFENMKAEIDIGYHGGASFAVHTDLWLNWPRKHFACLPVSLQVSLDSFAGKLILECPPPGSQSQPYTLAFQSLPQFNLKIGSTIGHSTKLVNVAKVSDFIQYIIRHTMETELVTPNGISFNLENGRISNFGPISRVNRLKESTPIPALGLGNSAEVVMTKGVMEVLKPATALPSMAAFVGSYMSKKTDTNTGKYWDTTTTSTTTQNGYLNGDLRNRNFSVYSEN